MRTLEGSCHCGAVRFAVQSHTPQPYMHCYCSICRKTAGGGGYAINIMGEARTLKVTGRQHLGIYRAKLPTDGKAAHSPARRHFCKRCGSALFISDPRWPKWVYPHASAIDTPLPKPKELAHIMLDSKAPWVAVPSGKGHRKFADYPDQSIADWHKTRKLYEK
jgi:hypothetical protein